MGDNVKPVTQRAAFLSRRVIIPSWLLVLTAITYTHMSAKLLITEPTWLFASLGIGMALIGFKLGHLLAMSEQAADENAKARRDNPNPDYSHTWRMLRTWPVWLITPVVALGILHLALTIIAWAR
jgi:hypothetical protein